MYLIARDHKRLNELHFLMPKSNKTAVGQLNLWEMNMCGNTDYSRLLVCARAPLPGYVFISRFVIAANSTVGPREQLCDY